jgi:AcrR family transcriptional regulator
MKAPRIDIGSIRREQIVDAAASVIAEQGLQNLSLSEIEKKVGMSRGQLMYYYKAKEDILLAVFDRLLEMMCRQHGGDPGKPPEQHPSRAGSVSDSPFAKMRWLEVVGHLLQMILQRPPLNREFASLQYTFLSQIGHREDFRLRLAKLYEEWRSHGMEHLTRDLAERPAVRPVSPRAVATLVQALLHGLAMQNAVDPGAMVPGEMAELCLDMLTTYLWEPGLSVSKKKPPRSNNSKQASAPGAGNLVPQGVTHE